MPFGLQPLDIIVIVVVALVIFGPKRLPQLGRWLGKTFSAFRKGAQDMADGFSEGTGARNVADAGTPAADAGTPAVDAGTPAVDAGTPAVDADTPAVDADTPAQDPGTPAGQESAPGNFCTACGAANAADARFCNKCGNRLPA